MLHVAAEMIRAMNDKKLFGIYFGGYREDISDDFVSSFDEHSGLCEDK